MKKQTLLIALLILTLTLSACGGKSELNKNRDKWDFSGVTHYRFELTISCFCPFMDMIPVTVEVKDGKIVSMTDVNGQPLAVSSAPRSKRRPPSRAVCHRRGKPVERGPGRGHV